VISKATILVVDDEEDILELVRYHLHREGYRVITAVSGEEVLSSVREKAPDLILLDLMLPGLDGLEVCRFLKADERSAKVPIIMLTAKGSEADIIVGLELGADDYITKPFSPRMLSARVKAVLRREKTASAEKALRSIEIGELSIHPDLHEVSIAGVTVNLTATEFRILETLARHPGRVFSRGQIVDAARGEDYPVTDRSVDVHIVSLRRKLGTWGKKIETVRGVGYRFRR
jgi:two-component system phosphate regulon response regulator PhoB